MGLLKPLCHTCCRWTSQSGNRMWEVSTHFSLPSHKTNFTPPVSLLSSHSSDELWCLQGFGCLMYLSCTHSFNLSIFLKYSFFLNVDHLSWTHFVYIISEVTTVYHNKIYSMIWFHLLLFISTGSWLLWKIYLLPTTSLFKWHFLKETNSILIAQKLTFWYC